MPNVIRNNIESGDVCVPYLQEVVDFLGELSLGLVISGITKLVLEDCHPNLTRINRISLQQEEK